MLVENCSFLPIIPERARKRKRRSSLYFSSSKALRRARMTRSKKVVSKTSQGAIGDSRRSIRFDGGASAGDEDEGYNVVAIASDMEEVFNIDEVRGHDSSGAVSFFDYFVLCLVLFPASELWLSIHHYSFNQWPIVDAS